MTNLKYFILLFQIWFFSFTIKAQYQLQPAFPNLPIFSSPTELVHSGDGTNRLFVLEQRGIMYVFDNSPTVNTRNIFLNLTSIVSQSGYERGLLGLAFHPDYENNRFFYVFYTIDSGSAIKSKLTRYTTDPLNPNLALPESEFPLLTIPQPQGNHKAGRLQFGNDGYLYVSIGDGGNGGDEAQDRTSLLGKILRIDVNNGSPYSIPSTNPFYENTQGYREEIYAYGLRNTWKFSIDFPSGNIWGADVGQHTFEEINRIESGKNYGWNKMEGIYCYPDSNNCDTVGNNFTFPIYGYRHTMDRGSITGGYVYRGSSHPALFGKYIYGDYNRGEIWALNTNTLENFDIAQTYKYTLTAFGEDENRELYLCYQNGGIHKFSSTTTIITLNLTIIIEGFFDVPNNRLNMRDTVTVYLRNTSPPYSIVDSGRSVIDSLTAMGVYTFKNTSPGVYYIVVMHRNSIETWSKAGGEFLIGGSYSYEFLSDSLQAYGNNLKLIGGLWTVYSGDVNQDGFIDASDLSLIDNDAFNSTTGYVSTDVNGDLSVDASDLSIVDNNAFNSVSIRRP